MAEEDEETPAERPPPDPPPELSAEDALTASRFRMSGEHAGLWFEGRGDVLIVSFDNLATVDEGWPRAPWMDWRLATLGYSVLGVQSHAKDWFRAPTAPALLKQLQDLGFFERFRKVVLMGASMGAFAALNYAPLIPGSTVLAFSPQSTMNKTIAPFEKRFPFSVRKSNWEGMPFLDAAAAIPYIHRVVMLYDPFVPEDKAHAARMSGPNVEQLKIRHATHEAIRVVLKSDAFYPLLQGVVESDGASPAFWRAYRGRRDVRKWLRAFIERLDGTGRPALTLAAGTRILTIKDMAVVERAVKRARNQLGQSQ